MANFFDQYDEASTLTPEHAAAATDNFFDQFDPKPVGDLGDAGMRGVLRPRVALNQFISEEAEQQAADTRRSFGDILDSERDNGLPPEARGFIPGPHELLGAAERYVTARLFGEEYSDATAMNAVQDVGKAQDDVDAIPQVQALQNTSEAPSGDGMVDTIAKTLEAFTKDGVGSTLEGIAALGLESAPSVAAGAGATAVTRSPTAGALVMGGMSGAQERYLEPVQFFNSKNIDISTPEGAKQVLEDSTLMAEAKRRGLTRGIIIGAVDALSGGVAGKTLFGGPLKNMIAQTAILQPGLAMSGEAAAGYATDGEIDWRSVTLEGLGEFASAPVEVATFGTDYVSGLGRKTGKKPGDVTLGDVAEDAAAGDSRAIEILKSAGLPDEQIAALSPDRQDAFATRIENRRAEDADRARTDPQQQPDGANGKFKKDQERLRVEGQNPDIDPAARSTAGRERNVNPETMTVDAQGRVDAGDAGVRAAVDRNRDRPTTETALVPTEQAARPMTDDQVTRARAEMVRKTSLPPGEDMVSVPEQDPRTRAEMDRDIGEIEAETGTDPLALVDETLGISNEDFRRLSPAARRRVVSLALEKRDAEALENPTYSTTDSAESNSEAPYSPASAPQQGAAQTPTADRGRGQQPTDGEIDTANPEYSRIATGQGDRPFNPESSTQMGPEQETFFRGRAEAQGEQARREQEEQLEQTWSRRRASSDDVRARNRTNTEHTDFATEPGQPGPDGRWPVSNQRILVDDDGRPVRFKSNRAAAEWAAKNRQGANFDRVAATTDGEIYLRANDNYERPADTEATSPDDVDGGPDDTASADTPRQIGRRTDTPNASGRMPWEPPDRTPNVTQSPETLAAQTEPQPTSSNPDPREYVDRWSDLRALMPDNADADTRIGIADEWVETQGANTGHEYIAVLAGDGSLMGAGTTSSHNSVDMSAAVIDRLDDPDARMVVTHNHPTGRALSTQDIAMLAYPGLASVRSRGAGGNSEASLGVEGRKLVSERSVEYAQAALRYAADKIGRNLQTGPLFGAAIRGDIDTPRVEFYMPDIIMRVLNDVGLIDYSPQSLNETVKSPYVIGAMRAAAKDIADRIGSTAGKGFDDADVRRSSGLRDEPRGDGEVQSRTQGPPAERSGRETGVDAGSPSRSGASEDSRVGREDEQGGSEGGRVGGPKLYSFPGVLFDADTYRQIGRDLKALLKGTTALAGSGTRMLQRMARAVFSSADTQIRENLRDDGLLSETAEKILNMFYAPAGQAGGVEQTFFEAIEERTGQQLQKLGRAFGDLLGNENAIGQVVNLVRNPRNIPGQGGTKAQQAARKIRDMLDEHLQYLRDAGVDVGEVRGGYFPREIDQASVLRNPAGFLKAATKAYMETGLTRAEATEAARQLHDEILFGHLRDVSGQRGGGAPFVKSRTFGKNVDDPAHPLNQFLLDDPVASLTQYINRSARRAEIARRFGDNFNGAKDMEKALIDEDAGAAIEPLREHIANMTGLSNTSSPGTVKWSQRLRMWGALMYLEKATLSSLGEVVMPAMRAGDLRAIGTSITETIKALKKRNPSEARKFAEDLGLIAGNLGESILSSRYAGADIAGQTESKVLDRYFRRTGLEQWTEATRVSAMQHGRVLLRRLAADVDEGGSRARLSRAFLQELGVSDVDAFAKWLTSTSDGMPSMEQTRGDDAAPYRTALLRFVDQTIMKPNKATRPRWSNHPLGAVVFHLQSFTHAFYNQVMKRNLRLARAAVGRDVTMQERARLLAPTAMMPVLFGLHAVMSELRDEVFRSDDSRDEESESQKFFKWMDRAGFFGPMSPLLNLFGLSSRYQNSVVDLAIGPDLGAAGRAVDTLVRATTSNNSKTNSAERATVKALYDLGFEPGLNYVLSRMGPGGMPLKAAITQVIGHHAPRDAVVDAVAGPEKKRGMR